MVYDGTRGASDMAASKRKSTIRPGLGNASFFARVPLAAGLLGEAFAKRHPYLAAHEAFVAGWITREQAVEHIMTDREFIAEAELGYLSGRTDTPPREAARRIVDNEWLRDAVRAAQQQKRRRKSTMRGIATLLACLLTCAPMLLWPSAAAAVAVVIMSKGE